MPWVRQLRVIGYIHNVNYFVAQPELYHFRLLFYHVKDVARFYDRGMRSLLNLQEKLLRLEAYDGRQ